MINAQTLKPGDFIQLITDDDNDLKATNYEMGKIYKVIRVYAPTAPRPIVSCEGLLFTKAISTTVDGNLAQIYLDCFRLIDLFQLKVLEARNRLNHES
ncbi:hypothetical protein CLV58_109104 [Spirosoma oryzae]|uniref:Uncharacterized protein n=1 Tax=Spirosoma oryzae TaxID=1469603 RepID=A0A2T0SY83_9BACT|nr:hypothetical protein CLV58_109104 [Spirosoma oryzae]